MPAAIHLSHRLVEQQAKVRKKKNSPLPWLRPDAKSQVTLRYENGKAVAIDAVVLSTQHDPGVKQKDLVEAVREHVLKPVLPAKWLHKGTKFHINPTGKFVIGGPVGDCGLTGRKIRSEEHTSELQSLMRSSYAVFCLKKKKKSNQQHYDSKHESQL